MAEERWNIYWNEYASDTCLYGSDVIFHQKDDVEFRNLLMPPGTVIRQWYSRTNYQMQRIEPALPMIDGESTYQLIRNIDCDVDAGCLIRLIFYDRYEVEAGSLVTRDRITDFQCPLKTYSYRMQLVNGGVTSFRFHSIVIREITGEIL
ncbi:MAG: accessory Sec system protein Asp3 [Lachnospiraceae bacterium]|nr:accessory Sec system protein Asp3 [Lachnospiraceae bacterium]